MQTHFQHQHLWGETGSWSARAQEPQRPRPAVGAQIQSALLQQAQGAVKWEAGSWLKGWKRCRKSCDISKVSLWWGVESYLFFIHGRSPCHRLMFGGSSAMSVILRTDINYLWFSQTCIIILFFSRNAFIKSHFERIIIPELFKVHIPTFHANSILKFLRIFFNYTWHSTLFCIGFRCTAWLGSLTVLPLIFPPGTIHSYCRWY